MTLFVLATALTAANPCGAQEQTQPLTESEIQHVLEGHAAGFVLMDTDSDAMFRHDAPRCAQPLPPCSTFKIWNTMIALQIGLVSSPNEPFYEWDGRERAIEAWNQDLTLGRAFAVSCVPAFQQLARRTGPERMQHWLDRIAYGDGDISAGIDAFWLPRAGRKTVLISADEQAALLRQLLRGELPFAAEKITVLREIMRVRETDDGQLFGKTGSGRLADGTQVSWFVGWVQSAADGKTRTFACVVREDGISGADVRAMVERILETGGLV